MRSRVFIGSFLAILMLLLSGCGGTKIIEVKQVRHKQNKKINLRLDTLTQKARTSDLIVTKDKMHIVTCSDDKTILLTNLETRKVEQKYLGEIGTGFGSVYAITLSKDERYLASGGWFAEGGGINDNKVGWIRIYDFKTAKVVKVLKGHTNIITDLRFSSDGRYLVSSSADKTIEVRRISDFKSVGVYSYPRYVNEFKIYKNQIISIDNDWKVKVRDLSSGQVIRYKDVLNEIDMSQNRRVPRFKYIAVNTKNIVISTGSSNDKIIVMDHDLNILTRIDVVDGASGLKYSDDGSMLIVGGGGNGTIASTKYVRVFDVRNNYKLISEFDKFDNLVMAIGFIDSEKAVGVGGNNHNIRVWNTKSAKEIKSIKSTGNDKPAVAFIGNKVIWRDEIITLKNELDKYFDIEQLKLVHKKINIANVNRLPLTYQNYKLNRAANSRGLIVSKNSKQEFVLKDNNGHKFFGFYKNYILSANNNGIINIYSLTGVLIYSLQGHEGVISSVHFNKEFIVSSGLDKTIRFWKLPSKETFKAPYVLSPMASLFIKNDDDWIMWTPEGYFTENGNSAQSVYFHINNGFDKEATPVSISKLYDHFFRPDLVKLKLQGMDINQFTNGLTFEEVLKSPPPRVSISKVSQKDINKKKRTIKLNFNVTQNDDGGIGVIRIYQEGKLVRTIGEGKINRELANVDKKLQEAKLNKLSKKKQKEYLAQLEVSSKSVNGLDTSAFVGDVELEDITNKEGSFSVTLPLKAGENSISIEAFNKTNTVASYRENITVNAKIKKRVPKIYVIAAGVNEFEQNNVSKLKYSENDAKTVAKEIKNATEYKTEVALLTGKEVTKENILNAIAKIKKKAYLEDKIVFYISTHGKAARGRLYLVPQNNKKLKNWINFEEIFTEIQAVAALDQIFIIDACESGQASDIMASVYDAKASVLAKQSGVHLLMATTKGTFAFESADKNVKHGVFTNNILKALKNKMTDKNKNGKISIIELSKTLQEDQYRVEHQFPIIRNVGEDTYIKKVRR